MKTVNIAEARANLSKLIDAAMNGEEIVISRRNKPLVKLSPVKVQKKGG
ncbi:MAG: prevent-host-death family protein [Myxococcota bacterium]|jgi:prevent-host-death family protein